MQVTETQSEGLKREFTVTVPAAELDEKLDARLATLKDEVRLKGFRPGKVPVAYLRRLYGRSAMAEIVQNTISEVARDTLRDRGERAAMQPDVKLSEDEKEAEKVLTGEADLTYTMSYEILPKVEPGDFKSISVERPIAELSDAEVDAEVQRLAENTRTYSAKDGKAENGDQVTIAYAGKIDGELFEGGSDENAVLRLGSGQFIPGFAEQLEGVATGDEKTITVTFPENYPAAHLAGKAATFDVTVKGVAAADPIVVNDDLAKRLGLDSLQALRDTVRGQLQSQYGYATRQKVKRQLLDQLDAMHRFELPPKMVDQEFDNIWRQITEDMTRRGSSFEKEGVEEEQAKADYRKIAERRVRLGLVLSEIGERNKIEVTDEEVQRALGAQLRQVPGQERQLLDYYRNNPDALAGLRAPVFEEKVIDFLMELVKVTDKTVSREELMREDEDETAPGKGDAQPAAAT